MARIITPLINECLDSHFYRVHGVFCIQLDTLKIRGLQDVLKISNFVHDNESIPFLKGDCDPAGVAHDWLCRSDSIPLVTKRVAAQCYLEVLEMNDAMKDENIFFRGLNCIARNAKFAVVLAWPGYWHKHKTGATYEEMAG